MHYWASPIEARLCGGQEVALVGAGNSAGQAAVYLAEPGAQGVAARARRRVSTPSMSRYLVERIAAQTNIEVLTQHRVTALEGHDGMLDSRALAQPRTARRSRQPIRHLFLFIGAEPNTDWLAQCGVDAGRQGLRPHRTAGRRADAIRWRPTAAACSRSATCAPARSSASRRRSAKARRWWRRCTPISRNCATHEPIVPRSAEGLMADECKHAAGDPRRDAERARLRGMPEDAARDGCICGSAAPAATSAAATIRRNRHATKHFHATGHPVIEGYDPPEGWGWCYVDEVSSRPQRSHDAAERADPALRLIVRGGCGRKERAANTATDRDNSVNTTRS